MLCCARTTKHATKTHPSPSIGGLTLAAGAWTLEKLKDYVPDLKQLKRKEETMKKSCRFRSAEFLFTN